MSIASRARAALRILFAPTSRRRGYDGARMSNVLADWIASATSSDAEIRASLTKLIARSRDLERNNDYQRGFLLANERNILGSARRDLRMDAGEYVFSKGKPPSWTPDKVANDLIETAWTEWGKKENCTVSKNLCWRDVKRLAVRGVPRDGNFLLRKIRGAAAGNRFGFALQLWEIDHLDLQLFKELKNGAEIRFGIEFDSNKAPVAYWLRAKHPGDGYGGGFGDSKRFPAAEIYHIFSAERAEQSVGVPWIIAAITRLRQLGAFEEAATVAARLGASKAGFFKKTPGPNGELGEWVGDTNASGHGVMDASPGSFEELPQGWELDRWEPTYPNIETGDFRKAMLRGVCAGIGVSYNTLGNDLESVNFSSARVGLFEEREMWKQLQTFYAENLFEPIFADWLEAAIMSGAVNLPLGKFAKFNRPVFKARRWPFIDPLKEVNAASQAIALRISSRRQFIDEAGGDVEDVFLDNLDDEKLAEDMGLSLQMADPQPQEVAAPPSDSSEPDADEEDTTAPAKKSSKPKAPAPATKAATPPPAAPAATVTDELTKRLTALEQRPVLPSITVNVPNSIERIMPAPVVNITTPPAPPQPVPVVNVTVPQQERAELPAITVNVPQQAAPVVNVTIPPLEASIAFERNEKGVLEGATIS